MTTRLSFAGTPAGCRPSSTLHSVRQCCAALPNQHASAAAFSGRPDNEAAPSGGRPVPMLSARIGRRGRSCAPCCAVDPAMAGALHAAAAAGPHGMFSSDVTSRLVEITRHVSLAYERVTLPCSSMNCGDVVYRRHVELVGCASWPEAFARCPLATSEDSMRPSSCARCAHHRACSPTGCSHCPGSCSLTRSTLDPALRMEQKLFPDWRGLALLGTGLLYMLATPGALLLSFAVQAPACCRVCMNE